MTIDWEQVASGIIAATVVALLTLGAISLVTEHKVDGYYLSSGSGTATCVYAHWTWHGDERAFCTNDLNEAVAKVRQLNEDLRAQRK